MDSTVNRKHLLLWMVGRSHLFNQIIASPAGQALVKCLAKGGALSCAGVDLAGWAHLAAALRAQTGRPIVLVVNSLKAQETLQQDLETWLGLLKVEAPAKFYPDWEVLPHEDKLPHADTISERLETLQVLHEAKIAPVITTTVAALMQCTLPPAEITHRTRTLKLGDRLDPLDFIEWLEEQGYEPEAQVTQRGDISLRGGIVDVFPFTTPWPVRCEFFGNELESLRYFNPLSQVSREKIEQATFAPGGEVGLLRRMDKTGHATLLEHLPDDAILLFCDSDAIEQAAAEKVMEIPPGDPFHVEWTTLLARMDERNLTRVELHELNSEGADVTLEIASLEAFRPMGARIADPQIVEAQRREFFAQLHRWRRQDHEVLVLCNNEGEQQRLEEIWEEYGFAAEGGPLQIALGALSRGFLFSEGKWVVVSDAEIFGRYKIQRPRRLKSRHGSAMRSAFDINFTELEEGDFVVHVQYGIGRYIGMKVMPLSSVKEGDDESGQECLVIEYGSTDPDNPPPKLYVPVSEAHLVSKYIGTGKASPPLNALGGSRWKKTKEKAKKAVHDLAAEMLRIQAVRETEQGFSFGEDTSWQREFEAAFLYEETPDQDKSIADAKADMESDKPMDRLICGDVGFGKTEVAIRTAFKAVMDGKQVAVLVPTTVLAQQHFNTFAERVADYPVRVDLLSRFRTKKQQLKTVKDMANGAVDIVVGTHRLVQPDVKFKDLGLVIIDEEQRFGVLHKDTFKRLRTHVDVLTMSATPIPRTLYLALTGARDMSTIETAPQDRLPVETIVAEYDEKLIQRAIQRELHRGGQVFFLHNRVNTIYTMEKKLQAIVPEARIAVGHGQMKSDELEEVMTNFINGEVDVLLSTTIIESGIDIPNANTIIIDRADRFGLSNLYQLRGRVGRYKHQAYAYVLLPRHAALLADARKRISAIKQYSSLGSGFKIAMRDLEIRGAGNLLGSEQSGHITAVGFELYCQLLKQSIAQLKGEKVKPRIEVETKFDFLALSPEQEVGPRQAKTSRPQKAEDSISVPRDENWEWVEWEEDAPVPKEKENTCAMAPAYIPMDYIGLTRQRIDLYRRLAQADSREAVAALGREMRDRFGKLPPAMEHLLLVSELKVIASGKGVDSIVTDRDRLKLRRNGDYISLGGKFPRLTRKKAGPRLREVKKLLLAL
ncbi:MAG: transcription-repair coupling factor [Pedosphaera sp.]|nr:transcription-repair coupling factor [Pedosphaera sp.]